MIHQMFEIFCMAFAAMAGIGLGLTVVIGFITLLEEFFDMIGWW